MKTENSLVLGCMRLASVSEQEAKDILECALSLGIRQFDHADIYSKGESERLFGRLWPTLGIQRSDIIIQSKCGIQKGYYDLSKEHILSSVDESLERLQTDYLDILLLHRPDVLMEVKEIAEAFSVLKANGKVKAFGVSNFNGYQLAHLQAVLEEPLVMNQMELSPVHSPILDTGLMANTLDPLAANRDAGLLTYCQQEGMTLQAWSPFQIDLAQGTFFDHPNYQPLNDCLASYAEQYEVTKEAIVIAYLLRLPVKMQVLVGTMSPTRLTDLAQAETIRLTREEWYAIYQSAGHHLP